MISDMTAVDIRQFWVFVRAIDTESKVLSIWITRIPQNIDVHFVLLDLPSKSKKSDNSHDYYPYWPCWPYGLFVNWVLA